jgi:hypothetical protein
VAEALAQNIQHELDGYERLAVSDYGRSLAPGCAAVESCFLRAYGEAQVDLLVKGIVQPTQLRYQLYETWTPALVEQGTIAIGLGSTLTELKQETLRAFHPILASGGLLELSPHMRPGHQAPAAGGTSNPVQGPSMVRWILLAIVLAMFIIPVMVCSRVMKGPSLKRLTRLPAVRLAVTLVAAGVVLGPLIAGGFFAEIRSPLDSSWKWVVGLLSGCVWGFLLLDSLRFAFAPLYGMERVGHRDVFWLVTEWFYSSLQRLCFVALCYGPVGLAAAHTCRALSVTTSTAVLVVIPAQCLVARLWIFLLVECSTLIIDDLLIASPTSQENPWHSEVHRYFMGYVKRTGWNIDRRLVAQTLFLPTRHQGLLSYGGGLIQNRVAINQEILLQAMGAIETAAPEERPIPLPVWSEGILSQAAGPAPGKERQRLLGGADHRDLGTTRPGRRRHRPLRRSLRRRPLGQAATLLGYVVPTPPEELVPLIADDGGDWDVVRELLAEHYAWFEPDPDEEDDDTDPTDCDFLFGALAREMGVIERRDHLVATVLLGGELWARERCPTLGRYWSAGRRLIRGLTGRLPAIIADAYAALHYARDHLIQYLYYRKTGERDILTARANPEALAQRAGILLQRVDGWSPKRSERCVLSPSKRNRLFWLSRLHDQPLSNGRENRFKKILLAAATTAAIALFGLAIKQAIDYQPIYQERINRQQEIRREIERRKRETYQKRPQTHGNAKEQRRRPGPAQEENATRFINPASEDK